MALIIRTTPASRRVEQVLSTSSLLTNCGRQRTIAQLDKGHAQDGEDSNPVWMQIVQVVAEVMRQPPLSGKSSHQLVAARCSVGLIFKISPLGSDQRAIACGMDEGGMEHRRKVDIDCKGCGASGWAIWEPDLELGRTIMARVSANFYMKVRFAPMYEVSIVCMKCEQIHKV